MYSKTNLQTSPVHKVLPSDNKINFIIITRANSLTDFIYLMKQLQVYCRNFNGISTQGKLRLQIFTKHYFKKSIWVATNKSVRETAFLPFTKYTNVLAISVACFNEYVKYKMACSLYNMTNLFK